MQLRDHFTSLAMGAGAGAVLGAGGPSDFLLAAFTGAMAYRMGKIFYCRSSRTVSPSNLRDARQFAAVCTVASAWALAGPLGALGSGAALYAYSQIEDHTRLWPMFTGFAAAAFASSALVTMAESANTVSQLSPASEKTPHVAHADPAAAPKLPVLKALPAAKLG